MGGKEGGGIVDADMMQWLYTVQYIMTYASLIWLPNTKQTTVANNKLRHVRSFASLITINSQFFSKHLKTKLLNLSNLQI